MGFARGGLRSRAARAGDLYQIVVPVRVRTATTRAAWTRSYRGRPSRLAIVAVVAVVLAFGALSAAARFRVIALDRTIGHSDTAAYAEIGRSLAEGRGLFVQYISSFYIPYPRSIDRTDDHWPPLMGLMIAPFFATLGVSAFTAKIPAVAMGAIGLPLAATWLGVVVSRRAWVGLAAGLLMVLNQQVFVESLTPLADVTLAALVAGFCAAMIGARSRPRLYLLAGALAALAYYAKLSELLLVGLLPITALLLGGPRVLRQRWLYAGCGVLVLGILPWQLANFYFYGSPIHSIHNYASGFIGLDEWEKTHYAPYWGQDLPRTSDRWNKYGDRYWPLVSRQREEYVRLAVLGSDTGQADWYRFGPLGVDAFALLRGADVQPALELTSPDTALYKSPIDRSLDPEASRRAAAGWGALWARSVHEGWDALGGGWRALLSFVVAEHRATMLPNLLGAAYIVAVLIGVPLRALRRGRLRDELRAWPRSLGIVAALLFLGVVHGTLLIYFFSVSGRFSFPALPIMAVLGLSGVAALATRIRRPVDAWLGGRWPRWTQLRPYAGSTVTGAVCALLLLFAAFAGGELEAWQQASVGVTAGFRTSPLEGFAYWMQRRLPADAVLMARYPWELRFYSPASVKTVATPWTQDPRVILGIANYYGVTHILADALRPELDGYLAAGHPGIVKVDDSPLPLYALDWSAIPAGQVLLPHQTTDARTTPPPPHS